MCFLRETSTDPFSRCLRPFHLLLVLFLLPPLPTDSAQTYKHIVPFKFGTQMFRPESRELYIAGIVSPDSEDTLLAIDLALKDFNNDRRFFSTITVKFIFAEAKCDAAMLTKTFFDMMHSKPRKFVLFANTCPQLTGPLSQMSAYWNIYQVTFSDTNPRLSERKMFTNILRVVPSDLAFNPAVLALLRRFHWRRVGTLHQDSSSNAGHETSRHSYSLGNLADLLEKEGTFKSKNIIHRSFQTDPAAALQSLKNSDVRVIVASFEPSQDRLVFCTAYHLGIFGERYVWIVLGDEQKLWWVRSDPFCTNSSCRTVRKVNCSEGQILEAASFHLYTGIAAHSDLERKVISGRTVADFLGAFDSALSPGVTPGLYYGYAYDAVWTVCLAAHRDLQVEPASATQLSNYTLTSAYNTTTFQGVTGPVAFLNGERLGLVMLNQFINASRRRVAVFDASEENRNFSQVSDTAVLWPGSGPPQDRTSEEVRLEHIDLTIYGILVFLASFGIVMAILVVAINLRYRRHRYIKMSSPKMNNIIIVGCILAYSSVFLLGADRGLVGDNAVLILHLCSARAWVIALSFTLSFGAMFSKTWRVHAIFTNITMNKKIIKDYQLVLIVLILLLIDVLILAIWFSTDPLRLHRKRLESELADGGDKRIIRTIEFCGSQHQSIWMGIIYGYKGLLLVFGCFLAWETRHVSIPALNDSKYIGMSVYNVVIMCVSGAAISFLIHDQQTAGFLIIALLILACTTITLALVFVPKIIELRRDPRGDEKRVRATLRKISRKHTVEQTNNHRIADLYDQHIDLRKILEERQKELEEISDIAKTKDSELEITTDAVEESQTAVDHMEITVFRADRPSLTATVLPRLEENHTGEVCPLAVRVLEPPEVDGVQETRNGR